MTSAGPEARFRIGVDVGGTFTDVIVVEEASGRVAHAFKLSSTPEHPAEAVMGGIAEALRLLDTKDVPPTFDVFHGTTIGTNVLIERRGARTALLTTAGFRDVLELRRQARPRLYALSQKLSEPLVEQERRVELGERIGFDGSVIEALDRADVENKIDRLRQHQIQSVAVSLLHSYANDSHEREIKALLQSCLPGIFVTLSSEVCREFREFERTSTAVVNAYIGPAVREYLSVLEKRFPAAGGQRLFMVKSNGGLSALRNAREFPVHLIESGPAAGVVAAADLGAALGFSHVIAYDMGGTTAKVGVVRDGSPRLTTEFYADAESDGYPVGGYPIKSPVIDLVEIGAGGGSIATIDRAGVMTVGPRSAGADPGPACYGLGGPDPTITDAHVVVGSLPLEFLAEAGIAIKPEKAWAAIETCIAQPMGWTVPRAAHAILDVATAKMAEMVRLATVRRGLDPRDYVLLAYGGCGPLHAADIAREVGIRQVIIPPHPGLFSASGTLIAEIRHDFVQTFLRETDGVAVDGLAGIFAALKTRALTLLANDGVTLETPSLVLRRQIDLRYSGQLFEVPIDFGTALEPLPDPAEISESFRKHYRAAFGYDLADHRVEIVNLRLIATAQASRKRISFTADSETLRGAGSSAHEGLTPDGTRLSLPIIARHDPSLGQLLSGPLLVRDNGATVRVGSGQTIRAEASGILMITT